MGKTATTSMNLPAVAGARRRNNRPDRGARRICQKPSGSHTPARTRRLAQKGEERREIVRVTWTAQREAGMARTSPPVEEVRADLWSVPGPIPDSPLRYTLNYLIAAQGGLVVVDPGLGTHPRCGTHAGWNTPSE